jgi:hypothetical protein
MEANIDSLHANRHTILKQCKVDGIALPLKRGDLKDVVANDTVGTSSMCLFSFPLDPMFLLRQPAQTRIQWTLESRTGRFGAVCFCR